MDKYYLLLRRYITASFRLLAREQWDRAAVKEYNEVMTGEHGPLNFANPKLLLSIAAHVCEVYPSCLASALETCTPNASTSVPLLDLLAPFVGGMCVAPQKSSYQAAYDHIIDPCLLASQAAQDEPAAKRQRTQGLIESPNKAEFDKVLQAPLCDSKGTALEAADVQERLLRSLFDRAAEASTSDGNRRRLYKLYRERSDASEV